METTKTLGRETEIYNDYVKDWKDKGGKVVGYACVATPVELIEAAGLLPYRIKALGNSDTELADGEMSLFNCSFCRACLQLGLDGTYDFLDGLVETNGCDHLRAMFENWQHQKNLDCFYYLKVPHFLRDDSLAYFEEQLEQLKELLEEKFSTRVSDEALEEAIRGWETVREKWRELSALRELEEPKVTGSEALALEVKGSSMRSEDFSRMLSQFMEERKNAAGIRPAARLMLCGPATDEVEWFEEIERLGAVVVADALCFGSRAFATAMVSEGDPLHRLAESYLSSIFCPRMYLEYARRRDLLMETARRARVDGAIYLYNKFCDLHGVDSVLVRRDLEEAGIPVLVLEKEYSAKADIGRVKTRVQAFMERIGGGA
ncbi:MAG: 2-hydroxyacyl-CoA dehydratase [Actinobacteria bacterium]|jgi:benzoyl-CoA reductase/2-hydroxyglutaryl-CoA dehydratase subunit BcrC/BadD/HgdB|nr:MAG: 2-hydroxyacyl-CoA dehydratase [Actinomycetota bacterium]